jgi:hypothetical protein
MPNALVVVRRYALLGVLLVALASVHLRNRPASLCLLRSVTGVPCPFCGGTTSAVQLGSGDVRAAFVASPIAPLMLAAWPLVGRWRTASWWPSRPVRWGLVLAVLALAEVWQLARFDLIHL